MALESICRINKYMLLVSASLIIINAKGQIVKFSNASISDVNFEMSAAKKMVVTYNIIGGKPSEKFDVSLSVVTASGTKLDARTLTGDLKGVPVGLGKKIIWDIGKDIAYLDENIHIELEAKQVNPKITPFTSKGKALIWSTMFPGAGSTRLGQNGSHILKGIVAYACIGLSVKFNRDAVKAYDGYKLATTSSERNDFLNQTESKQNVSNLMVYGAVTIWVADYLNILIMKNKTDNRKGKVSFKPIINQHTGKTNLAFVWSF